MNNALASYTHYFFQILKEEQEELQIRFIGYDKLCQCEGKAGDSKEAIRNCNEALKISEEARIYCDRAEAHILNEDFDDGE